MKRLYIDEINKHGDKNQPGPGRYQFSKTFGAQGLNFSMASKLPHERQALDRSKKLPGPGSYDANDMTGKNLNNSTFRTNEQFSIGKDGRFQVPTKTFGSPSPDAYNPLNNLNQNYNSTFQKSAQAVFGKNTSSVIDQHYNLKKGSPGPGKYNRFSEFDGYQGGQTAK